ncbi:hypothetical protein [Winogradskya humida]|nr:hypothetical protein [Actinoplanes humidus]
MSSPTQDGELRTVARERRRGWDPTTAIGPIDITLDQGPTLDA